MGVEPTTACYTVDLRPLYPLYLVINCLWRSIYGDKILYFPYIFYAFSSGSCKVAVVNLGISLLFCYRIWISNKVIEALGGSTNSAGATQEIFSVR